MRIGSAGWRDRPAQPDEVLNRLKPREVLKMNTVVTGLQRWVESPGRDMRHKRLGLLCNPASVDSCLRHARELIAQRFPGRLTALYAPQHGFFAEKQDNMVESADGRDPFLGIPVFSLYGETRVPTARMFEPIDVLLVDLQDIGTRVYTFIYTMSYCLEAARKFGKKVVVLDRPNPIGGNLIEGNCLKPAMASFVGRYPLPMRHGLTIGELALLFNGEYGIGCDLTVVAMRGWQRGMVHRDTGLPWVAPSPNMPTPESALVYPGQVLWEATNVSEGRGTTQPFELFGAPFINPGKILAFIGGNRLPGATLRPVAFEPTANKWAGELCYGFQIHVTRALEYRPYAASLSLLQAVIHHHGDRFQWKPPPYEYEYRKLPIDLIVGDEKIRRDLESNKPLKDIQAAWQPGLEAFDIVSRRYHLYPAAG